MKLISQEFILAYNNLHFIVENWRKLQKPLENVIFISLSFNSKTGWLVLLFSPYEIPTINAFAYTIQAFYLYYILDQPVF